MLHIGLGLEPMLFGRRALKGTAYDVTPVRIFAKRLHSRESDHCAGHRVACIVKRVILKTAYRLG